MTEVLLELINNIKLISTIYPRLNLMLGISNLSSTFGGNNKIREALHCTFLRYTKLCWSQFWYSKRSKSNTL